MIAKSSALQSDTDSTRPNDLGKLEEKVSSLKLPQLVNKNDDKEVKIDPKQVKQASANVNEALNTIDKNCPALAPTLKLIKDKKIQIGIQADDNAVGADVDCTKDGEKHVPAKIKLSLGLAALPTNKEEQAILIGSIVKALTFADKVNSSGNLPTTAAEKKDLQDCYVKNLTTVRDSLTKEGSKDSLEIVKGLEAVLKEAKK